MTISVNGGFHGQNGDFHTECGSPIEAFRRAARRVDRALQEVIAEPALIDAARRIWEREKLGKAANITKIVRKGKC